MIRHVSRSDATPFTSSPNPPAPHQFCPVCARPLVYRQTVFGLAAAERRDYYECRWCGPFKYLHGTHALMPAAAD